MDSQPSGFFRTYRRLLALTFLAAFLVVSVSFVLYGLSIPPEYLSVATLQLDHTGNSTIKAPLEFDALAQDLDSDVVGRQVVAGLTDQERNEFMAPFEAKSGQRPPDIFRLLFNRHWATTDDASESFSINFEHPNPEIAARVANLYAAQCVALRRQRASTSQGNAALLQITSPAVPGTTPYEPKLPLLISDGVILGLNLAAGLTFLLGAILRSRWRSTEEQIAHKKA